MRIEDPGPTSAPKVGLRGGWEIARGLFGASVVTVVLGVMLLIGHVSTGAVVIGVLLIVVGMAVVVRYSNKGTGESVPDRVSRSRRQLLLALTATYAVVIVAIRIATQHVVALALTGLVALGAFLFRRR